MKAIFTSDSAKYLALTYFSPPMVTTLRPAAFVLSPPGEQNDRLRQVGLCRRDGIVWPQSHKAGGRFIEVAVPIQTIIISEGLKYTDRISEVTALSR